MTKEKDYIFSQDLRNRMERFGDMSCSDAISSPDFFNELMLHAGMSLEEIKAVWVKVGRQDVADATEFEES